MQELTTQQASFVAHFTSDPGSIGNGSEACRRAGYSEKSAGELSYQLLRKPHVLAAIDKANRDQLSGALATKAVHVLRSIIEDEKAPAKIRLDAAKTVLDRIGVIAPKAKEPPKESDDPLGLSDLSTEELKGYVAYLQKIKGKAGTATETDETAKAAVPHLAECA